MSSTDQDLISSSINESPFAPPKSIDPSYAAQQGPAQHPAFTPPPLASVPLMQVPDLDSTDDLEEMILRAQPQESPFGTTNDLSARHRAIRRADFTRPRIPQLQQDSGRHSTQEKDLVRESTVDEPKPKRRAVQKLKDFFKQISSALKSLTKD